MNRPDITQKDEIVNLIDKTKEYYLVQAQESLIDTEAQYKAEKKIERFNRRKKVIRLID